MSIYKNRRDAGIRLAAHLAGLETPEPFRSVGRWYDDFAPVTDAEVLACLRRVPRA